MYLGTWDNLGKLGLSTTNHREGYTNGDPVCSTPYFLYLMRPQSIVKTISKLSYICFSVFRKLAHITDTQKAIQSVKLHISHQMKPNSSVKAIWGSCYTCVSVFATLWWVGEIGPKYIPRIMQEMHGKSCKVFNATFHSKWSLIQWYRPSESRFMSVFVYLGI